MFAQAAATFFFASGTLNGTRVAGLRSAGLKCTAAICAAGSVASAVGRASVTPGPKPELLDKFLEDSKEWKKAMQQEAKDARKLAKDKDTEASYSEWLTAHAERLEEQAKKKDEDVKKDIQEQQKSPLRRLTVAGNSLIADGFGVAAMAVLFKVVNSSFIYYNVAAAVLLAGTSLASKGMTLDTNTKHYMTFKHSQLPKEANVSLDKTIKNLGTSIPVGVMLRLAQTTAAGVLAGYYACYVIHFTSENAP